MHAGDTGVFSIAPESTLTAEQLVLHSSLCSSVARTIARYAEALPSSWCLQDLNAWLDTGDPKRWRMLGNVLWTCARGRLFAFKRVPSSPEDLRLLAGACAEPLRFCSSMRKRKPLSFPATPGSIAWLPTCSDGQSMAGHYALACAAGWTANDAVILEGRLVTAALAKVKPSCAEEKRRDALLLGASTPTSDGPGFDVLAYVTTEVSRPGTTLASKTFLNVHFCPDPRVECEVVTLSDDSGGRWLHRWSAPVAADGLDVQRARARRARLSEPVPVSGVRLRGVWPSQDRLAVLYGDPRSVRWTVCVYATQSGLQCGPSAAVVGCRLPNETARIVWEHGSRRLVYLCLVLSPAAETATSVRVLSATFISDDS